MAMAAPIYQTYTQYILVNLDQVRFQDFKERSLYNM